MDFGAQGDGSPTPICRLPAVEFMEGDGPWWGLQTDRAVLHHAQSSSVTGNARGRSSNRFFQRGPRLRMSAEMIRDNALRIFALLSERMAGPPLSSVTRRGFEADRSQRAQVSAAAN